MRALVLVLDSVGVGQAPDAARYGDAGADTLGHILERIPDLDLANLNSLGLRRVLGKEGEARASFGRMRARSAGKDTTTGHWEIAGVMLEEPFATFAHFPEELVRAIERAAGVSFLGNYARSGTEVLDELGEEHLRTGKPILTPRPIPCCRSRATKTWCQWNACLRSARRRETPPTVTGSVE